MSKNQRKNNKLNESGIKGNDSFNVKENLKKLSGGMPVYGDPYSGIQTTVNDYNVSKEPGMLGNSGQSNFQGTPSMLEISNNMHTTFNNLREKFQTDINTVKGQFDQKIEDVNKDVKGITENFITKERYNTHWNIMYLVATLLFGGTCVFIGFVYNDMNGDINELKTDSKDLKSNIDKIKETVIELKYRLPNQPNRNQTNQGVSP